MKEVVVLRHADKDGDKLTEMGIQACIDLSKTIGEFSIALSSNTIRAKQTAELLTDLDVRQDDRAGVLRIRPEISERLIKRQESHPLGIVGAIWEIAEIIPMARNAGLALKQLVEETMQSLGNDDKALIISHDGTIVALEKLLNNEGFDKVDHTVAYLDGLIIDEKLHTKPFAT